MEGDTWLQGIEGVSTVLSCLLLTGTFSAGTGDKDGGRVLDSQPQLIHEVPSDFVTKKSLSRFSQDSTVASTVRNSGNFHWYSNFHRWCLL